MSPLSLHQWRALLFMTMALLVITGWRFTAPSAPPVRSAQGVLAASAAAATPADKDVSGTSGGERAERGSGHGDEAATGETGARDAGDSDRADEARGAASREDDGRVDINTADAALLQTLPGIGPVLAHRIIEYREMWGPFHHPTDLMEVSGIGPRTFERLRDYIRVGEP